MGVRHLGGPDGEARPPHSADLFLADDRWAWVHSTPLQRLCQRLRLVTLTRLLAAHRAAQAQPAALRCSITKKTRSYPSEGMWRPILLLHVLTLTTIWPSHVACPAAAPWGLHHKFEPRGRATMRPPVGMALSVRCGKCASLKKGTVSYTCSQPGCPPCRYC